MSESKNSDQRPPLLDNTKCVVNVPSTAVVEETPSRRLDANRDDQDSKESALVKLDEELEMKSELAVNLTTPKPTVVSKPSDGSCQSWYELHFHVTTEKLLGEGGCGAVYRTMNKTDGQWYAVKKVFTTGGENLDKAMREIELLATLDHKNILRYYGAKVQDIGSKPIPLILDKTDKEDESTKDEEGRYVLFIQTEWCQGGTLQKIINSLLQTPIPDQMALQILCPLASALEYIHSNDVIHRDIKPANVFIDVKGTPKFGDFGVGRRLEETSNSPRGSSHLSNKITRGCGTDKYAPREQMETTEYDASCDIFLFGLTMLELVEPMDKNDRDLVTARISRGELPTDLRIKKSYPDVYNLWTTMVSLDPSIRPSAQKVSRVLKESVAAHKLRMLDTADYDCETRFLRVVIRIRKDAYKKYCHQCKAMFRQVTIACSKKYVTEEEGMIIEYALSSTNDTTMDQILALLPKQDGVIKVLEVTSDEQVAQFLKTFRPT